MTEPLGPGKFRARHRTTARQMDRYRTTATCGRQLTEEEIETIMGRKGPGSNPPPSRPPGPTGPDKNPPCPPNPPVTE